jgi:hypothetical protein
VPVSHIFHNAVVKIFKNGITTGCGGNNFCPDQAVNRDQMAVFVLRGEHNSGYTPPGASGQLFTDVTTDTMFAGWMEQFYAEGIIDPCDHAPLAYCPSLAVSRAEMAVLLLRAKHSSGYVPPNPTGVFSDVPEANPRPAGSSGFTPKASRRAAARASTARSAPTRAARWPSSSRARSTCRSARRGRDASSRRDLPARRSRIDARRGPVPGEVREGLVEILVEDDFEARTSREVPVLVGENGERTPLFCRRAGRGPGDWVRVEGWTSDRGLVVEQTRRFERDASATAAASTSWSTGTKRALAILVNFTDDHAQPYTVAQARTTLFGATGSVAAFYAETSFGGTTLTGDVAGWYTLAMNKPTTCDVYSFVTKAQAAAAAGGYAVGGYQFVIYVFPKIAACGWAGLGSVGGSGAWINQALSPYVAGHELGHNYGLSHAHSLDCGATAFGATCQRSEYGDPFDIMGGSLRHFNAASRRRWGGSPPPAWRRSARGPHRSPCRRSSRVRGSGRSSC